MHKKSSNKGFSALSNASLFVLLFVTYLKESGMHMNNRAEKFMLKNEKWTFYDGMIS